MGNINDATLQDLNTRLNAKWTSAYSERAQLQQQVLATEYTSTTASNFYAFLEALGGWSKWNGARQFKDIASQQFEVLNEDYEMSIKMPKNQIEDDQVGMYEDIVPEMVEGWYKLKAQLVMDVLTSNPLAYDGVALFSAAGRSYGSNVINNYTTSALTATTFEAAYVAMMSYLDHAGKPLAVRPDTLIVGPKKAKVASDIIGNRYIGDGETSASQIMNYYNSLGVRLVVDPHLVGTYDDYWYLADTRSIIKGVLLQIRETPAPIMSNAQEVARNKTIDYMADGRLAAAPGAPHKIYGGIVA